MQLGKLEKVDLRKQWKFEENFSEWLAGEENISLLSEEIGIEFYVVNQEEHVGPFRADILCKDENNHFVLIENQIEKTDHKHLGQLMTYAAGLEAVTIIWISKNFTDEHRAAIDWLNGITSSGFNFFAIEIELYKIGDSLAAPKFNIVAQPNDWSKTLRSSAKGEMSETKTLQLEFWKAFCEYLENSKSKIRAGKPQPQHWLSFFGFGKSGFHVDAFANTWDKRIGVIFLMTGDKAKENYFKLKEKYEIEINKKFNNELIWKQSEDVKECKLALRHSADIRDRNDWNKQHKYLKEKIEDFFEFFVPLIKQI
ncbi:MAG: DUF4268 domain-containing protein [Ignavibacteriae bacterium]|nr:DUF4268 domain-containing protein [Ignavibacteriota bacterium]